MTTTDRLPTYDGAVQVPVQERRRLVVWVSCLNQRHRVVFEDGFLGFPDHDVHSEGVAEAVGSIPPTCQFINTLAARLDWDDPMHRDALMDEDSDPRRLAELGMTLVPVPPRLASPALRAGARDPSEFVAAMELRRFIESMPEPQKTGVRVLAALTWFEDQLSPHDLRLKQRAAQSLKSVAPGPVDVRCFVIPPHWKPGITGWTDGRTGLVGLFVRPNWFREIASPGRDVLDDQFVLKGLAEAHDDWPDPLVVRWDRSDFAWHATSVPSPVHA
ncbi:MAG TPA: hypothetical protein VNE62_06920 [Actinomycetota bacterium]|nr:hypothetical protein [Actinomycetota bacterium]